MEVGKAAEWPRSGKPMNPRQVEKLHSIDLEKEERLVALRLKHIELQNKCAAGQAVPLRWCCYSSFALVLLQAVPLCRFASALWALRASLFAALHLGKAVRLGAPRLKHVSCRASALQNRQRGGAVQDGAAGGDCSTA